MEIEVMRRIILARHLYGLATSYLKASNDLYLFSAVNLLQDAVEAFLLGISDHVNASLSDKITFDKYFVHINEKIAPIELPFKPKLLRLNRIRVDSKHHGIQPARDECDRLAIYVREFFDEVCYAILHVNFSTVSTIDLLNDGEVKNILLDAKYAFENGNFPSCSISCRKAIYLELEHWYDISCFKDGASPRGLLWQYSRAPFYTRNSKYIEEEVNNPTDLIVIDHSDLDNELIKYGVDNTTYWNVWRLTPEVYRNTQKQWIIKNEFDKLDVDILKDQIEYIFSATVDIVFTIHTKRAGTRSRSYGRHYIELKQEEVHIYEKADKTSKISYTTPKGVTKVDSDYSVEGLNNDGLYWHVRHSNEKVYLSGYLHGEHVKRGAGSGMQSCNYAPTNETSKAVAPFMDDRNNERMKW